MSSIMSSKHGGVITNSEFINFSTAKQKFSFGKGDRFPQMKRTVHDQLSYELPPTFGKRAPSFGVGNRFDLLKNSIFLIYIIIPY